MTDGILNRLRLACQANEPVTLLASEAGVLAATIDSYLAEEKGMRAEVEAARSVLANARESLVAARAALVVIAVADEHRAGGMAEAMAKINRQRGR